MSSVNMLTFFTFFCFHSGSTEFLFQEYSITLGNYKTYTIKHNNMYLKTYDFYKPIFPTFLRVVKNKIQCYAKHRLMLPRVIKVRQIRE